MKASLVFLAAMDLMKLLLLASYAFQAFGNILSLSGAFPYAFASLAFFFSLALSRFLRRKNMRIAWFALIELAAFAFSFAAIYSSFLGDGFDLTAILPQNDGNSASYLFMLTIIAAFWLRAAWLEAQKADHEFCAARFDEGIALLLAAFLLTALTHVENPFPSRLVIPFFLFGILALGMSKSEGANRGGLSPKSRRAMVASVAVIFVLAGAGILLLVPALTEPARQAVAALKRASVPVLRMILDILQWLFRERRAKFGALRQDGDAISPNPSPAMDEQPANPVVMWIVMGVMGLFALSLLGFLIVQLLRLLASRTKKVTDDPGSRSIFSWLKAFFHALAGVISRIGGFIARNLRRSGYGSAALAMYARLLAVGRFAGLPRKPCETAREYSLRLAATFPASAGQAAFIAETVEREVYGGLAVDAPSAARFASLRPQITRRAFLAERLRLSLRNLKPRR